MKPETTPLIQDNQAPQENLAQSLYGLYERLHIPIRVKNQAGGEVDIADEYVKSLLSMAVPLSQNDMRYTVNLVSDLLKGEYTAGTYEYFKEKSKPAFEYKGEANDLKSDFYSVPVDIPNPVFYIFSSFVKMLLEELNPFTAVREFFATDEKFKYVVKKIFIGVILNLIIAAVVSAGFAVSSVLYKAFQLIKPFIPLAMFLLVVLPLSLLTCTPFDVKLLGTAAIKPITNFLLSILNLGLRILFSPLLVAGFAVEMFSRFKKTPVYQQLDTWIDSMKKNYQELKSTVDHKVNHLSREYEELKSAIDKKLNSLLDGKNTDKKVAPEPQPPIIEMRERPNFTERVSHSMQEMRETASSKLTTAAESVSHSMSQAKTSVSTRVNEIGTAMSKRVDAFKAKFFTDTEKEALLAKAPSAPTGDIELRAKSACPA